MIDSETDMRKLLNIMLTIRSLFRTLKYVYIFIGDKEASTMVHKHTHIQAKTKERFETAIVKINS